VQELPLVVFRVPRNVSKLRCLVRETRRLFRATCGLTNCLLPLLPDLCVTRPGKVARVAVSVVIVMVRDLIACFLSKAYSDGCAQGSAQTSSVTRCEIAIVT